MPLEIRIPHIRCTTHEVKPRTATGLAVTRLDKVIAERRRNIVYLLIWTGAVGGEAVALTGEGYGLVS